MRVKTGDLTWKVSVLTPEQYVKEFGQGSLAMCLKDLREVYFIKDYITPETIRHELFHMFMELALIQSCTRLAISDFEECAAEVMGKYGEQYFKLSQALWAKLKKFNED